MAFAGMYDEGPVSRKQNIFQSQGCLLVIQPVVLARLSVFAQVFAVFGKRGQVFF